MKRKWSSQGLLISFAESDTKRLAVTVSGGIVDNWIAMAAETPLENVRTLAGVLGKHSHKALAENVPLSEAIRAAEGYMELWEAENVSMEDCECKEIDNE